MKENTMDIKIFGCAPSKSLANAIAKAAGTELSHCNRKLFSDGEIWVKYDESIRGADVFIIQSTQAPADNLMELLVMIDAAKRASAQRITAVIPYYGYARQDRKDAPRTAITAKLVADLLTIAGANRIITMDLHAAQIQGFFNIPVDHLYGSAVFMPELKEHAIQNLVVVSPDVGGVKRARAYAKFLSENGQQVDIAIIDKRRPKANKAEVMNIVGNVKGKNALLVDDLADTLGTLDRAARALKKAGAKNIYGNCTHPVLSGKSMATLSKSPIKYLWTTNTIPLRQKHEKIKVLPVEEIFAEAIIRAHDNKSISSLFLENKN